MVACVCVCAGVTTFGASQSAVTETAAQRDDDDGGRVDFQYSLFLPLIVDLICVHTLLSSKCTHACSVLRTENILSRMKLNLSVLGREICRILLKLRKVVICLF